MVADEVEIYFGSDRIKRYRLFGDIAANSGKHKIICCELSLIVSNPLLSKIKEGVDIFKMEISML
jgi:alcohol dehydrogenase YqhD (iron-dependent ADH family)